LLGIFFSYAFFKKPGLLGPDFAELRKQLIKMVKKNGKGGGKGKGREKDKKIILLRKKMTPQL
jgi:hypothetical protein